MASAVFFLLALFVVTYSLGGGLLILTLFTYQKLGNRAFLDGAFIIISGIALTTVAGLPMVWKLVDRGAPSVTFRIFSLTLTAIGNGFMAGALPRIAFRILGRRVSPSRWTVHGILIASAVVTGVIMELTASISWDTLDKAVLLFVHSYATGIVLIHFKDITNPLLRSILKVYFGVFFAWLACMIAQTTVFAILPESSIWRGAPIGQLIYQISMSALILYCAGRYIYQPEPLPGGVLARDFAARFGISNRESEIIGLIIQGYNNGKIAEKLFISTRTVKNHVYNIYQKTKVENKIQLMNLIRSNGLM